MEYLLQYRNGEVEAKLFLARHEGIIRAGAFVIRCGRSLHYLWGATDRSRPQVGAGEAVQWAAIEWGFAMGCTRYDLGGIDPKGNPGTYAFKNKMGGVEVTLCGKRFFPFGAYGRLLAWLGARCR
jgi:lipid II:glycine glycyltransferase (peptidoglycan interpeptide bridge formation enzyme)